jgi:hypothetical protein
MTQLRVCLASIYINRNETLGEWIEVEKRWGKVVVFTLEQISSFNISFSTRSSVQIVQQRLGEFKGSV